ncbi:MAG TPA: hypothetical protein VMI55_08620 [Thermoplasmata archaeon]|nr:hypothetical protein [Thermoplasmata archaeon]
MAEPHGVLVVGETPSLGRSIADLLESENVPTRYVFDLEAEAPLASLGKRYAVIVAACSGYFCATARRWMRGEMPGTKLVVVGSRDPILGSTPEVRQVDLPLRASGFMGTVREMLQARSTGAMVVRGTS